MRDTTRVCSETFWTFCRGEQRCRVATLAIRSLIANSHDAEPSVLLAPLDPASQRATSDAPSAKRVKLADTVAAESTSPSLSIAAKIQNNDYATIHQLEKDIATVCESLLAPIDAKEQPTDSTTRPTPQDLITIRRVTAFRAFAHRLLAREYGSAVNSPALPNGHANGVKQEATSPKKNTSSVNQRTVLALYGNAPTARQLFSSLQRIDTSEHDADLGAEIPLEELGLPNMLTATKLLPLARDHLPSQAKQQLTFADRFAPPASLAQLAPPKTARHLANRSNSISWLSSDALVLPKPARKGGYPAQSLTTGNWIRYGATDSGRGPTSPSAKRKQRDRALSLTEVSKPPPDELALEGAAEEEALFRAAFSSFAPTHDNTKALVPEETRNIIWWHKLGEKRYDAHFVLDPALEQATSTDDTARALDTDEIHAFEQAVEDYDGDDQGLDFRTASANVKDKTPAQLLTDISGLLETLSSHQRIRNSHTSGPSRTPASPSPALSAMLGRASSPSPEETATYKTLRSQLAEMIVKLPPYALAKLDGEQLEQLSINKTLLMQAKAYPGSMEEDQLTRLAKGAAIAAASGATRPTAAAYGSSASQYGRTPSGSQTATRSAHAPQSYARTPAASYQRSTSNQNLYNTPSASAPRQSYTQMATYSSQPGRQPPPSSYGQTPGSQFYQRPTYNQQYSQAAPQPQAQMRANYPPSNQAMYANRAQNTTAFANNATGNPYQASTTPARSAPIQPPPRPTSGQNGQAYAPTPKPSSGRATPTSYASQAQTPSALGPSGFHTSMTSEQQQLMMERQRAQLAAQPPAPRMAVPGGDVVGGRGSTTPQPAAPTNGGGESARPVLA